MYNRPEVTLFHFFSVADTKRGLIFLPILAEIEFQKGNVSWP